MHPNDNEFDQPFRDRLRNHSSPVRGDLWRRIHTGIGTPGRPFHLFRYWRYLGAGAGAITVAFAAHLILTPSHPSRTRSVSHYSNIPAAPAAQGAAATHFDSVSTYASANTAVTHLNTNTPDSAVHNRAARQNDHMVRTTPSHENLSHKDRSYGNPSHENRSHEIHSHENLADDRLATDNPAHENGATPSALKHVHYPVTLPAVVRTAARPAITIHPTLPRTRHNDPGPGAAANDQRPIRTGYISLYGSLDFPANHYYTWSGSLGGTVTIQISRHWSGTAGLEYGKVNVPTQVVPPDPFDTLHAFYFSNYEVPVLIGYTMMLGSYSLTVNGGAIINIRSHQSNSPGNMITSATSTWVFNWPNRDAFGAYLGADIFRPLSHALHLFAQPYARFSLSDYRMFIPQQRFFYGVHAGIRYQL
jgi:hypothetical protein